MEGHGKGPADRAVLPHGCPECTELEKGYEQQLDDLRERTQQAERTGDEQAAQLERLRSDLP